MKVYEPAALEGAPDGFKHKEWRDRDLPGMLMTIQVAPDDCTGCGICIDTCPARSKEVAKHKSLDVEPKAEHLERERASWDFFLEHPGDRPHARRGRNGQGLADARAAVRVLRRVLGLRRDARI